MPLVKTFETDIQCGGQAQVPPFKGYLSVVLPSKLLPENVVVFASMVNDCHQCLIYPFRDDAEQFWRVIIRAHGSAPSQRQKVIE